MRFPLRRICLMLVLVLLFSLAACSRKPKCYEVRFELNGGTLVSGALLQQVPVGFSATLPTAEREGYRLSGWSEDPADVRGDMVVVAQWTRLYQVSFDPGAGTIVSGADRQQLEEGQTPAVPEVTIDQGEFLGWEPPVGPVSGDVTYRAQWELPKQQLAYSSQEIFEVISPSVVEITVYDQSGEAFALGSGFFIDDKGMLVTNYHVMEGAFLADVTLSDGSVVDVSEMIDYSQPLDLALIRANVTGNPWLPLSEDGVTTGETVYALGSSLGLTGTFSDGIVSRSSRQVEGIQCIQTTAPISRGNSGGPLVNAYGQVVGINSMTLADGQNLNFAIDVQELENLDRAGSCSLWDFGLATAANVEDPIEVQTGGYYDELYDAEIEWNDSWRLADRLESESLMAADLSDYDDVDFFCISVTQSARVYFVVLPYYLEDAELPMCIMCSLEGEELEIMGLLELSVDDDNAMWSAWADLEPGDYYLAVTVDPEVEEQDVDYPLYYAAGYWTE